MDAEYFAASRKISAALANAGVGGTTNKPPFGLAANAPIERSISSALRAGVLMAFTWYASAAALIAAKYPRLSNSGLKISATLSVRVAASLRNASHRVAMARYESVMPVALPAERARFPVRP